MKLQSIKKSFSNSKTLCKFPYLNFSQYTTEIRWVGELSTKFWLPLPYYPSFHSILSTQFTLFALHSNESVSSLAKQINIYPDLYMPQWFFEAFLFPPQPFVVLLLCKMSTLFYLSTFLFCQQQTARARKFFHQSQAPSVSCARSRLRADSCWCWKYEKYINFIYFSWPSGKYLLSRRCSNCSTLGDSTAVTSSLLMDFEQRK